MKNKNIITIIGLTIIAIPFLIGGICLAIDATTGNSLTALEANYKNAIELHDITVTAEAKAAKVECQALATLAAQKLVLVNSGELEGDKADLAAKAGVDCFPQVK